MNAIVLSGDFAARLDDVANYLPARLTAFLMVLVTGRLSLLRILYSVMAPAMPVPNSGYPEAALAGILDCRLESHQYFGEWVYETLYRQPRTSAYFSRYANCHSYQPPGRVAYALDHAFFARVARFLTASVFTGGQFLPGIIVISVKTLVRLTIILLILHYRNICYGNAHYG